VDGCTRHFSSGSGMSKWVEGCPNSSPSNSLWRKRGLHHSSPNVAIIALLSAFSLSPGNKLLSHCDGGEVTAVISRLWNATFGPNSGGGGNRFSLLGVHLYPLCGRLSLSLTRALCSEIFRIQTSAWWSPRGIPNESQPCGPLRRKRRRLAEDSTRGGRRAETPKGAGSRQERPHCL
jgi:hypothetical protein